MQVCLPSIVQEFLRQAKAGRLFKISIPYLDDNSLESEFSKAFGGIERLDMFFPFDPYLLKDSDRFVHITDTITCLGVFLISLSCSEIYF